MEPTPTAANPGGAWYDPLASLALAGLEAYTAKMEAKASTKPNNVTVLRSEDINPATGTTAGVTQTGSAGVSTSRLPAWIMPAAIGAAILGVVVLLFSAVRRR